MKLTLLRDSRNMAAKKMRVVNEFGISNKIISITLENGNARLQWDFLPCAIGQFCVCAQHTWVGFTILDPPH